MPTTPSVSASTLTPRTTGLVVVVLLALFAVLLIGSVHQESQTFDEPNHLFADLSTGSTATSAEILSILRSSSFLRQSLFSLWGSKSHHPSLFPFFKAQDGVNGGPRYRDSSCPDKPPEYQKHLIQSLQQHLLRLIQLRSHKSGDKRIAQLTKCARPLLSDS
jgi:hypothetical protein